MANTPTLSVSARTNLLSLQRTSELIGRTQERLASGKKVNSAIDDALSYFKARSLDNRASDLATVKDGISQAVNSLKSATDALESVERVLTQMKALADSAKAASDSVSRMTYASQFNDLRSQIDTITADASFGGVNLLKSSPDNLTVRFNERGTNTLQIVGADTTSSTSTGVNVGVASAAVWANIASAAATTTANATIDSAIAYIDSALLTVRTRAQTFGTNSAMLDIRKQFTENLINTLSGGAAQLVNADLNTESANMLSMQTRQQLGTVSLNIAQQSEQSVMRLF